MQYAVAKHLEVLAAAQTIVVFAGNFIFLVFSAILPPNSI